LAETGGATFKSFLLLSNYQKMQFTKLLLYVQESMHRLKLLTVSANFCQARRKRWTSKCTKEMKNSASL